jgi:hypothetical protein
VYGVQAAYAVEALTATDTPLIQNKSIQNYKKTLKMFVIKLITLNTMHLEVPRTRNMCNWETDETYVAMDGRTDWLSLGG